MSHEDDQAEGKNPNQREPRPSRRPGRRWILALALVLSTAFAAYALVDWTSLFTVHNVQVTGGPPEVTKAVERALKPIDGDQLLGLDRGQVKALARTVPAVLAAEVERDFPDGIHVKLTLEEPVGVVRSGPEAWVVSGRGRIIEKTTPTGKRDLPRIWITSGYRFSLGAPAPSSDALLAAQALHRLPPNFPLPVESAIGTVDNLNLVVGAENTEKLELRLGPAVGIRLKLAVAAEVLSSLGPAEAGTLAYLDVSVPERPVASSNPQVAA
ncbi:MAG: cell division protein FtsQ/DivIB [Gaiellaceae bacterium]